MCHALPACAWMTSGLVLLQAVAKNCLPVSMRASLVKTCDRAQLSRLTNLHTHFDLILLFINHALFSALTADELRLSLGMGA
jgi:hypothetical protein